MLWTVLRELAELSAWTGLSVLTIVGCVAVILYVPALRQLAVFGIVGIAAAYGGSILGEINGRGYVRAQWDAANAAAEAARQKRDKEASSTAAKSADAMLAALARENQELQRQVDDYAKQKHDAGCKLGDLARDPAAPSARRMLRDDKRR
jgi:predicted exporter